jgi:hypothetical protein
VKPQHFAILAVSAAALFFMAVVSYISSVPWSPGSNVRAEVLFPNLAQPGAEFAAIEVKRAGDTVRIETDGNLFRLASHDGYPADPEKILPLIRAASEARLVERKTALKDRHELLGLQDPDATGSSARLLRLLGKSDALLGEIILGRTTVDAFEASKGGTYVRRPGENQTWLVDRQLSASLSLRDWVKTRLIDLSPSTIKSVRVEHEGGESYDIVRAQDGKEHQLATMPAGKKLKYVNAIDDVVEAVSLIEFRSVRKAGHADKFPVKGRVTMETDKGYKPVVEFRSDGSQTWVRVTASGGPEAKAEVDDLLTRAKGWDFEVPMTELNASLIKLQDLLEDAPA